MTYTTITVDVDVDSCATTHAEVAHTVKRNNSLWASAFTDHGKGRAGDNATVSKHWDVRDVKAFATKTGHPRRNFEGQFAECVIPNDGNAVKYCFEYVN